MKEMDPVGGVHAGSAPPGSTSGFDQSILHKNHTAMFMINVHCIMYKLYEPMKIK